MLSVDVRFVALDRVGFSVVMCRYLGICEIAQVAITQSDFAFVFRVVIVAELLFILNSTIPCIVDGMDCSQKRAGRPRIISSSDLCLTTEYSIILVTLSSPPWQSSVNGRFMVLSGHNLRPMKQTSGARVGGIRLLFQDSRSHSRQCS